MFINVYELFPKAYEVGIIFQNLMYSICASCIFYFFVVYIRRKQEINRLKPSINQVIKQYQNRRDVIVYDLKNATDINVSESFPTDLEELKLVLKDIDICKRYGFAYLYSVVHIHPNNWYEYFKIIFKLDTRDSDILFKHSDYLNSEMIKLINEVQTSSFKHLLNAYHLQSNTHEFAREFHKLAEFLHTYLKQLNEFESNSWV